MNKIRQRVDFPKLRSSLLVIAVALIMYSALLIFHLPRQVGLSARFDFLSVFVPAGIILYIAFVLQNRFLKIIAPALVLALFALPINGLWASGISDPWMIGGLLPWSDASGYYYDARQLLEGGLFSTFSARRPIFVSVFSFFLLFTKQNLQLTLALLGLLVSSLSYVAARGIQQKFGALSAVVFLLVIFGFYRGYIGTATTENLGLALGLVGFILLWRAAFDRNQRFLFLGILVLTTALNTRSGAFFVLPALVLWAGWYYRNGKLFSLISVVLVSGAIVLGFAINMLVLRMVALPGGGTPFANFAWTFYGMSVGGQGWTQVFEDHPELLSLPEPDKVQKTYEYAFEEIRENPLNIVKSAVRAWGTFFSVSRISMFGYMGSETSFTAVLGRLFLYGLLLIGILSEIFLKTWERSSIVAAAFVGILLSVPFIPPWDAGMRVYAATIPFMASVIVPGVSWLSARIPFNIDKGGGDKRDFSDFCLYGIAFALMSIVILSPIISRIYGKSNESEIVSESHCSPDSELHHVRVFTGSYVVVVDDSSVAYTWLPQIQYSRFAGSIHDFQYSEVIALLDEMELPALIMNTYDLEKGRHMWLVANQATMPDNGIVAVCGNWAEDEGLRDREFFFVDTAYSVSANK